MTTPDKVGNAQRRFLAAQRAVNLRNRVDIDNLGHQMTDLTGQVNRGLEAANNRMDGIETTANTALTTANEVRDEVRRGGVGDGNTSARFGAVVGAIIAGLVFFAVGHYSTVGTAHLSGIGRAIVAAAGIILGAGIGAMIGSLFPSFGNRENQTQAVPAAQPAPVATPAAGTPTHPRTYLATVVEAGNLEALSEDQAVRMVHNHHPDHSEDDIRADIRTLRETPAPAA